MRLFLQFIIMTLLCSAQTINEQIKELEHAPPKQRVELMNHIKEQLILMNQEERAQTINKLRAKLQPHVHREMHQRVPIQMRNHTVHLQQTNIEHQESQRHIIDIKNNHIPNHISSNQEQPITHQPITNQPTVQTHTEQPITNQPTVQTHTEQPITNQPTVQTHVDPPVTNQPTVPIHTEPPITNQPKSPLGRGGR
ncbi:MAG: hypothetical protein DSZ11_01430 [Sulfurovum sp.]|nr:MAG: hypothetical protein DSZ11_01430 [Sulfurovum sp.]